MDTTGEEKGEGSAIWEDLVLGGEFSIPFICDHRKLWQILEQIHLGKFLFKDLWGKVRGKYFILS